MPTKCPLHLLSTLAKHNDMKIKNPVTSVQNTVKIAPSKNIAKVTRVQGLIACVEFTTKITAVNASYTAINTQKL